MSGGPLCAVIEAQTQAARATADFIKRVGFDQDKPLDFPDRLVDWLRRSEETRKRHRRSQLAPLSALLLGQAQGLLHEAQTALEPRRDEAARLIQQML